MPKIPVYPYRNAQRTRRRMAVVCVDNINEIPKKDEIKRRGAKVNYTLTPDRLPGKTCIFYTKVKKSIKKAKASSTKRR